MPRSCLDRVRFSHDVFNKLAIPSVCVRMSACVRFEVYNLGRVRLYVREVGG